MDIHQPEHFGHEGMPVSDYRPDQQLAHQSVERRLMPARIGAPGLKGLFIQRQRYVLHARSVERSVIGVHMIRGAP